MAQTTDMASGAIDHSERQGRTGLLLALAALLTGAALSIGFLAPERAQPIMLLLLAFLGMAGVFFLFAWAIGAIQFSGHAARNDLTRVIANTAPEALVAVEGDGRLIYANEAYLALAGGDSVAGVRPVERLFVGAPEVSEAIYRLAQAARDGRAATEEVRVAPPPSGDREFAWYRIRVRPLALARPSQLPTVLWSIADVTHERQRQENVFQELQHAIDYLDHAPAGFLSIDGEGRIVYMNATLATWLGYDLAQVGSGGLDLADIASPNACAMLDSSEGEPSTVRTEAFDLDLKRRNGQALPVRVFHRVAFDKDGRPGASRTLVLNRSAGEDVDEGQRAAEVRFARFFNSTPIAIATLTRSGQVIQANASFARLFGIMPRPGGERRAIFDVVADRDREAIATALKVAAEGRGDLPPTDLTLAGEASRSVRLWLSPVSDSGADGEAAILYALDISEQRQLEQQFAQAQKMQAVGQLAGGVAHDFNNVLQAIIGYSDLLLANHRPTDPAFQDIMQIKQNANRAASLVRQLLAFSRRQTLRPEVLDLNDVLSDLSMLLKRLLGERVALDLRHGRDLWPVKADVNQFEQVIVNLAVNARDAMPDGGKLSIRTANVTGQEAARLGLQGLPAADFVTIEVADTGTGIPPEVIDKIFEPFFTTKEVGKGTGLGLSTVFGIVKQSNGFIYVDSTPGEGTTFRVFLPRHVPSAEEAAEQTRAAPAAKKPAVDLTGQGVILLVEDEDPVRAVNARALAARGYTVLEAASGVEALQVIEAQTTPVDLVVSDVVMPEMDGPTLLGELRKRYPGLKVIFVSGYAEDAFKRNLPEGEEFNFLAKPFTLKQLVEAVKQAMAA